MATTTNNRHGSAVSFTRSRGTSQQVEEEEDDDIQISLAPYIQSYLAQSGQKLNCCGVCLPIPFERAAQRSWWNPRFDSEILEGQYRRSSFPQVRLRFQYSLFYILTMCLSWFIYFVISGLKGTVHHWVVMASLFAILLIITVIILILTQTNLYFCYTLQISSFVAVILCIISLSFTAFENDNYFGITPMGQFSLCIEILLIIYTVIPLPLYICFCLSVLYSILFEYLSYKIIESNESKTSLATLVRILLHLCVHLIGIHILIMTNVRMRGTFMKVGQSLLVRRQLEIEKQLKEKMIHSVMPPKVAAWLISEGRGEEGVGDESLQCSTCAHTPSANSSDIRSLFRPFNMHRMENVSILFADIVGFTRMSSNKSAEELVGILNDLFERFDELCATYGCEKISTLGDCYYCVAGCPEPKPDHAKACIEMGLGMICAIKEFDAETNEGVNMRVGVHTGTVLCGIVGTKRFKFDVWSNDVTLANQMESTGKPGRVHLSQTTAQFLEDAYLLEEGNIVQGLKTYFVVRHKSDTPELIIPPSQLKLSPSPQPRIRVHSCLQPGRRPHYLQLLTGGNVISEGTQSKACSLPSILDSDNDDDNTIHPHLLPTSPISLTSPKGKSWCYTKGLSKNKEEMQPLGIEETSQSLTHSQGNECLGENVEHTLLSVNAEKAENLRSSKLEVSSPNNDDQLSVCVSVNSRKDSGIRSNSRRSSIQQQIFVMNGIAHGELLTHRVSGYYTSSQSSLNEEDADHAYKRSQLPSGDNFGICLQKLRKQSDLQLIRCVQDNVTSHRSYFVKPPLCGFTLFFRQKEMEKDYRTNAHRITENSADTPPTLATSRFNTYFDILISALIYFGISASLFLLFKPTVVWVSVFIIGTLIEFCAVLLCTRHIIGSKRMTCNGRDLSQELIETFSSWYPWHIIGAVLVSLPIISVLVSFDCLNFERFSNADIYYSYLIFIGLVHFCNFTQLNCWMKSCIATWSGICYVTLAASHICPLFLTSKNESQIHNQSLEMKELLGQSIYLVHNESNLLNLTDSEDHSLREMHIYSSEIFIDILLLLILVWFLNREFEISYRLSFHGNIVAARDKAKVQNMKNQADQLLHNIIPKHVADQLKNTAKYSQNHRDVGIIFASIVNFNEMYDESYLGGKEYLRVLNELISDFDELLTKQEFKNVEKIKTIGSTFMAASGLNPEVRKLNKHPYQHLVELMDFAIAMQKVIDDFNRDLLEFNLVLRVGYNFGDVTAGVIGTTKLYYDIWGDAVNIASRMDSTGVRGHIQVGNNCIPILSEFYEFEYRGSVYVKGKDDMNVFLLKGKKDKMILDDG